MNERRSSLHPLPLVAAAGLGALLMYLLDPQLGRRRTALLRDQATHLGQRARSLSRLGQRDLSNRTHGMVARWRSKADHSTPGDEVLVGRVRARIGRLVSHPHAVQVSAHEGVVTLEGPLLRSEEAELVAGVRAVRGVQRIDNRLELHYLGERVPALQGGERRAARAAFLPRRWAPGPRLLAGASGTALALFGLARRSTGGSLLGLGGLALLARALSPGRGASDKAVEMHKTIRIAAPPEAVFELWSHYENFPRFMSTVEAVQPLDGQRVHWVVRGPAGTRVEWDAVTYREPPHRLAWHSEPDSPVQHQGSVRLLPDGEGTRVTVQMRYVPPGGTLGHAVASLFGRNPRQQLDEDLLRMKAFIETGRTPHDAAALQDRGSGAAETDTASSSAGTASSASASASASSSARTASSASSTPAASSPSSPSSPASGSSKRA